MHGFRCLNSVQIGMPLFLVTPVNFGISSCFDAAKPCRMRTVSNCDKMHVDLGTCAGFWNAAGWQLMQSMLSGAVIDSAIEALCPIY